MSKAVKYRILKYIIGSILCIIINFIYSLFGHGVHSNYMTYMFIIPLFLGPTSVLANIYDNKEGCEDYNCSLLCLVYYYTMLNKQQNRTVKHKHSNVIMQLQRCAFCVILKKQVCSFNKIIKDDDRESKKTTILCLLRKSKSRIFILC